MNDEPARLLDCGFCYEEHGQEVHPHPECPIELAPTHRRDTMTAEPHRYRQRPLETDAIQWTGPNAEALRVFAGSDFDTIDPEDRIDDPDCDAQLLVEDSHWVALRPGDWVLKFPGCFVSKSDEAFRAVWGPVG